MDLVEQQQQQQQNVTTAAAAAAAGASGGSGSISMRGLDKNIRKFVRRMYNNNNRQSIASSQSTHNANNTHNTHARDDGDLKDVVEDDVAVFPLGLDMSPSSYARAHARTTKLDKKTWSVATVREEYLRFFNDGQNHVKYNKPHQHQSSSHSDKRYNSVNGVIAIENGSKQQQKKTKNHSHSFEFMPASCDLHNDDFSAVVASDSDAAWYVSSQHLIDPQTTHDVPKTLDLGERRALFLQGKEQKHATSAFYSASSRGGRNGGHYHHHYFGPSLPSFHVELEAQDVFKEMMDYFSQYGFWTYATSKGFMNQVIRPNVKDVPFTF